MSSDTRPPLVRPVFLKWSLLVLFLLTPFVSHAACDYAESSRLARIVQRIRDAHEPASSWEAQKGHYLNGEPARAARFYRAAAALGASDNRVRDGRPLVNPDGDEALGYLDRAADLRFEGIGPGSDVPYLPGQLMAVANLASKRTRELSDRGDGSAAAASIYSAVRLTRAVNQTVLGGTLGVRAAGDVGYVLAHTTPDERSLARLASSFAEVDRDDSLKQLLIRQRAFLLDSLRRGENIWLTRPIILRAMNTRLEQLSVLIARASRPWPGRLTETPSGYSTSVWNEPFSDARMILSMRDGDEFQFRSEASAAAQVRAARLVIAAARYRAAHHTWPPAAAALVPDYLPAVPIDPFRGEPMRTLIEDDGGFVAYSVGLNNRDERGKLLENAGRVRPSLSRAMADGDIGIRIPAR